LIAKACVAKGCDAALFGCDGLDGIITQIDDTVTNKISYITPFDVKSTDTKVSAFVAAYEAKYNATPDQFAAGAYDTVMAIYEAMKKANVTDVTISAADLAEILVAQFTSDSFSYDGVTGNIKWDESGAPTKDPKIVYAN
jgi:branched-chain amino acid transport system substrate-binding protein